MLRFAGEEFQDEMQATIGVDLKLKSVNFNDTVYRVALWDTAGQERFRVITPQYYRNARAAILVYDVSEPSSFFRLTSWLEELNAYADPFITKMLVGNKSDKVSSLSAGFHFLYFCKLLMMFFIFSHDAFQRTRLVSLHRCIRCFLLKQVQRQKKELSWHSTSYLRK